MRTTGYTLRMVRTPRSRVRINAGATQRPPTLERSVIQDFQTPERRLRPGEENDMHNKNGLSRKGTTG